MKRCPMPPNLGLGVTVGRDMLSEYGRQSCIELPNYDAMPGQRDRARKRQETVIGLTPSCGVA
jgi:hypothetical protein